MSCKCTRCGRGDMEKSTIPVEVHSQVTDYGGLRDYKITAKWTTEKPSVPQVDSERFHQSMHAMVAKFIESEIIRLGLYHGL